MRVSVDAVKIENTSSGFFVLAKAPDWQVYCYRLNEKKYWSGNLELFTGLALRSPYALPKFNVGGLNAVSKVTYAGLPCTKYVPDHGRKYVFFGADNIPASAKVCEILCRYYFVTLSDKVPIYRKFTEGEKRQLEQKGWLDSSTGRDLRTDAAIILSTTSAKKIPYNSKDFVLPPHLTRIKEISEIGLSKAKRQAFGELMDEFGNTSQIDKRNK